MTEEKRGTYSLSDIPSNVCMGEFCSVAGGVRFHINSNHPTVLHKNAVCNFPFKEKFQYDYYDSDQGKGEITVGNDVWIGEGARILDGVTIGNGAIIAAGTVVTKDVPAYALYAGNPGRVKRLRFTPDQIERLETINWWGWDMKMIEERMSDFKDINVFLEKYYDTSTNN